ncbi:MAG: hypothetical protein IAF94_10745 [Pirellulaceae bacterium]|nr:hypothetical protein [Pirellulaceae bacterium]
MNETPTISEPNHRPFWGHRQQVTALVIAHLGLACLASTVDLSYGFSDWQEYVRGHFLTALIGGFLTGQLTLLASWGAFADQPWFLRIPRFISLMAWSLAFIFLAEYLTEGVSAKRLVEEYSAALVLLLISPVVVLFSIRAGFGRQFLYDDSQQAKNAWQFTTRHLLFVTTELAVFLALGRFVFPPTFSMAEFWTALTGHRPEEMTYLFVSVTVLPVFFIGLARRRTWQLYLAIGLYFLLPALGLAWRELSLLSESFGPEPWNWWVALAYVLLDFYWMHVCAAATILITFWLVRRIGYDFRRRDDGPLGRSSSNARNSAASASA